MKTRLPLFILMLALATLVGCAYMSGEQLYKLPGLPNDLTELQKEIDIVLSQGAEYAYPVSGLNRQPIQIVDLDNDGINEAVTFFRSPGENPLKIHIYKKTGDSYSSFAIIEHPGESIDSITYRDLSGGGSLEMIVGWQLGQGAIRAMSVYSMRTGELTSLLNSNFSAFTIFDLNDDQRDELILIRLAQSDMEGAVEVYSFNDAALTLISTAQMSVGLEAVKRVRTGYLIDGAPALLVSSSFGQSSMVTDIFAYRDGTLVNLLLNPKSQLSEETERQYAVYSEDVNKDGAVDLPHPEKLPVSPDNASSDVYWTIDWRSYDLSGTAIPVATTYHNYSDGWFYTIPESWKHKFTISRSDPVSGERISLFSYLDGKTAVPFMKIYLLTGDNRVSRASINGRFEVFTRSDFIIAAELLSSPGLPEDFVQNKAQVMKRLKLIEKEWPSSDG